MKWVIHLVENEESVPMHTRTPFTKISLTTQHEDMSCKLVPNPFFFRFVSLISSKKV